jgi:tRNA(adenine34) deaminase
MLPLGDWWPARRGVAGSVTVGRRPAEPVPGPGRPGDRERRSSLSGLLTPRTDPAGSIIRRRARAAESARLEIVCGETHRGFKSHRLRHMGTDATSPPPVPRWDDATDGPDHSNLRGGPGVSDEEAMGVALEEATAALAHGDVPVGAVALRHGRVIAARHNERQHRGDPTAHAELLALADAAAVVGSWRLSEVTLVVTLEPCPMCAGGLVAARVGRLVFGAADPKAGACGSLYNLCADPRLNHEVPTTVGVRAAEASALLTAFFEERRRRTSAPQT